MSGNQPATRPGSNSAQIQVPGQTPTSTVFPSPTFDTPQQYQDHFVRAAGCWTPNLTDGFSALSPPLSQELVPGFALVSPINHSVARFERTLSGGLSPALGIGHPSPNPNANLQHESQIPTPPSTVSRGNRKLAPKLKMHDDQTFGQPDFMGAAQPQDINMLLQGTGELYDYPMSAPVTAPPSFWDDTTNMSFNMDMGFVDTSGIDWTQPPMTPSHRPTNSFEWDNEITLFAPSQLAPSPARQEPPRPAPPQRRERVLAPKPPAPQQSTGPAAPSTLVASSYHPNLGEPFGTTNSGLESATLFNRPQTSGADSGFPAPSASGSAGQIVGSEIGNGPSGLGARSATNSRVARNGKLPDRASASSPIKPSTSRPGLSRSFSENRGRKAIVRSQPITQGAASRLNTQAAKNGISKEPAPKARQSGRTSPLKNQSFLSALESIPESAIRPRKFSTVELVTVNGRAELVQQQSEPETNSESRGSGESNHDQWDMSDEESSDDEPIIIPSRNTSFALPDPLKPVGSIFDSMNDEDDVESEAETIMNEGQDRKVDAASELRKVVENRQKQAKQANNAGHSQKFQQAGHGRRLSTSSSVELGRRNIRCVCTRTSAEKDAGYLIKCDYCDFWLHGDCVNLDLPSRPPIYVCGVCAMTPKMGSRMRDPSSMAYNAVAGSPLASKSFKGLR